MTMELVRKPASSSNDGELDSSSAQTISGPKTFTGAITPSGGIVGSTSGVAISAGYIGEYKEALGTSGAISSVTYTVTSNPGVVLTTGIWEVQCIGTVSPATSTILGAIICFPSTTNTNDNTGVDFDRNAFTSYHGNITNPNGDSWRINTPVWRINVTSTTTYYPKIYVNFGTSTCNAKVSIFARRVG